MDLMTSEQFNLKDFLSTYYNNKEDIFREVTRLNENDQKVYNALIMDLININSGKISVTKQKKGKALENLVAFLIERSFFLSVFQNLRNSTNEIDQIVKLKSSGKDLNCYLPFDESEFLCECKNYNKKIGVTWVGKFFSLLTACNCKLGILFSYYGFTGTGWNSAAGLSKKLFLRNGVLILDFNIDDFRAVAKGDNIFRIIQTKIDKIKFDCDLSMHISHHPAE